MGTGTPGLRESRSLSQLLKLVVSNLVVRKLHMASWHVLARSACTVGWAMPSSATRYPPWYALTCVPHNIRRQATLGQRLRRTPAPPCAPLTPFPLLSLRHLMQYSHQTRKHRGVPVTRYTAAPGMLVRSRYERFQRVRTSTARWWHHAPLLTPHQHQVDARRCAHPSMAFTTCLVERAVSSYMLRMPPPGHPLPYTFSTILLACDRSSALRQPALSTPIHTSASSPPHGPLLPAVHLTLCPAVHPAVHITHHPLLVLDDRSALASSSPPPSRRATRAWWSGIAAARRCTTRAGAHGLSWCT